MNFTLTPGPPQPSMVFRYLRMLEGISPPLALLHSNCQATAKAFIATRAWWIYSPYFCPVMIASSSFWPDVFTRRSGQWHRHCTSRRPGWGGNCYCSYCRPKAPIFILYIEARSYTSGQGDPSQGAFVGWVFNTIRNFAPDFCSTCRWIVQYW